MAIGIDVTIDPSGAVSGGRTAVASLDAVEKAADQTTRSTSSLREELDSYSRTAYTATQRQLMYGKTLQNNTGITNRYAAATDTAGASMNRFNGFVGQAGFQLSDIAIQLGAGANAAMVFGIQGGQLLGFLSPLAGALATVAGILVGQFTGGMYGSAEATRELEDALSATNKEINEMSRAQALLAQARLTEGLTKDITELNTLNATIAVLNVEVDKYRTRVEGVQDSQLFGKGVLLAAEEFVQSIKDQEGALDAANLRSDELRANIDAMRKALENYNKVLEGNTLDEEDAEKVAERRANTIKNMSESLDVLRLRVAGSNREAAIQEVLHRTNAKEGSEYAKQVELLAGQQYDLQQQLRATNDEVKNYDKDGNYLQTLERQVELVNLSAREQAILRAEYALSEEATERQIQQARELAAALFDAQQARKQRPDTSDEDFETSVTGTSLAIAEENTTLLEELENQRQIIQLYQEEGIGDARAHAAALVAIDRQATVERANIAASGFGSLLALQQAYGDDSSGIYRTLLIAQKAATLSSVLLSSYDAIGKAWASAPFPYNLPAVATATVETGALSALVTAVTPSYATGGLAYGPGTGTSDSFTANLSNGEFIMPQRETMRNLGTLQAMRAGMDVTGGGGMPNLQIVNQTTGRIDSASMEYVDADTVRVIMREEMPGMLAAEVNNEYSQYNKAHQQQYVTQRKF